MCTPSLWLWINREDGEEDGCRSSNESKFKKQKSNVCNKWNLISSKSNLVGERERLYVTGVFKQRLYFLLTIYFCFSNVKNRESWRSWKRCIIPTLKNTNLLFTKRKPIEFVSKLKVGQVCSPLIPSFIIGRNNLSSRKTKLFADTLDKAKDSQSSNSWYCVHH